MACKTVHPVSSYFKFNRGKNNSYNNTCQKFNHLSQNYSDNLILVYPTLKLDGLNNLKYDETGCHNILILIVT